MAGDVSAESFRRYARSARWPVIASLIHALLLWGVYRMALPLRSSQATAPPAATLRGDEIDIALVEGTAPRLAEPAPAPRIGSSSVTSAPPFAERARASRPIEANAPPDTESPPPPERAQPSAESEEPTDRSANAVAPAAPRRPSQPIDLGLAPGAWQRWVFAPEAQPQRREAPEAPEEKRSGRYSFRAPPASIGASIAQGLADQDRARGLGPSGRVISAFYRAAHNLAVPELGVARYRVSVLRSGAIEVSLASFSSDGPGWRALASGARAALQRAPPRLTTSGQGLRWLIEIKAESLFPNGLDPKSLHGARVEVAPPRFRSVESGKAELHERNPTAGSGEQPLAETKANVELPGVYVSGRGKVCGYRVGISALGPLLQGGCDPVNAGAAAQRLVRVRALEEVVF